MFSGFGLSFFRAATQPKKAEGGDASKDSEASKGSGESASASAKKEGNSSTADAAENAEEGEEGEVEDDRRTLRGNEKGAEGTIQQNGDGHVVDVSSS